MAQDKNKVLRIDPRPRPGSSRGKALNKVEAPGGDDTMREQLLTQRQTEASLLEPRRTSAQRCKLHRRAGVSSAEENKSCRWKVITFARGRKQECPAG